MGNGHRLNDGGTKEVRLVLVVVVDQRGVDARLLGDGLDAGIEKSSLGKQIERDRRQFFVPRFMLARAGLFSHCAIHRRLFEGAASLPDYILLPVMGAICDTSATLGLQCEGMTRI